MNPRDLLRPGPVALTLFAVGAVGFLAGFVLARDPERVRKISKALAEGFERASGTLAETREELGDLWAQVTDEARKRMDETDWSAGVAAAAAAAAPTAEAEEPPAEKSQPRAKPRGKRAKSSRGGTKA